MAIAGCQCRRSPVPAAGWDAGVGTTWSSQIRKSQLSINHDFKVWNSLGRSKRKAVSVVTKGLVGWETVGELSWGWGFTRKQQAQLGVIWIAVVWKPTGADWPLRYNLLANEAITRNTEVPNQRWLSYFLLVPLWRLHLHLHRFL